MNEDSLKEYYKIFDLEIGATEHEIRKAYRDLAFVWHPDRFSNNLRLRKKAEEKLKEINIAYKILLEHLASIETEKLSSKNYSTTNNNIPNDGEEIEKNEVKHKTLTIDTFVIFLIAIFILYILISMGVESKTATYITAALFILMKSLN